MKRALVALVALAGCVAPGASLGPEATPEPSAVLNALALEQPSDGGEPTIAVLDASTIFLTAKGGNQDKPSMVEGASWLWRSKDGGATWELLREPIRAAPKTPVTREPVRASDPDVLVSPDGWVYYLDWWIARSPLVTPVPVPQPPVPAPVPLGVGSFTNFIVERSSDGGDTWEQTPITIPMTDGRAVDRPWMVAGPDGFLAIAYNFFGSPTDSATGLRVVVSRDHGATWGEPIVAVADDDTKVALIGHPWMLPSGRIVLPYGMILVTGDDDPFDDPAEAWVALSDDDAAMWTQVKVADAPGGFEQIWPLQGAVSPDGRAYVTWGERRGEALSLWLSASDDGGDTWGAPSLVADAGANILPWIAAAPNGRVAVGYYHADITIAPRDAETTWYADVAESLDGGQTFALRRVEEPAKIGIICPEGTRCETLGIGNRELQDYVGLAYGPDGTLHFSYTKSRELGSTLAGHIHYTKVTP